MDRSTDSGELLAIDNEWMSGDRAVARAMATVYVGAHPELSARYGALDIPALVALVESARTAGDEDERRRIDAWLLSEHQPQVLTGRMGG